MSKWTDDLRDTIRWKLEIGLVQPIVIRGIDAMLAFTEEQRELLEKCGVQFNPEDEG